MRALKNIRATYLSNEKDSYSFTSSLYKIKEESKVISKKKCYIIKDKSTGFYKIGCSKNPIKRERTLQAEKPTYELIKIFDNNIEKELHKMYDEQRVRGEWFKLTKIQVRYICTHF